MAKGDIVPYTRDQAAEIVARFEAAVREHEMKGAQRPEHHELIEREYEDAKRDLIALCEYDGG